jgi:hypothetical protein
MTDRTILDYDPRHDAAYAAEAAHPASPPLRKAETGVHPIAIESALGAALWFLAVTWVGFARGGEIDWDLVVVTFFFVFFFGLLLLTASTRREIRAGIYATRRSANSSTARSEPPPAPCAAATR